VLTRRILTTGLGATGLGAIGLGLPSLAQARTQVPVPAPTIPPKPPGSEVLLLDAALDSIDRLTVAAFINGQGPFDFVVDTGADRSVLSRPLAERLGLARGPDVLMHGIGGSAVTPTAHVALITAGDSRLKAVNLPVLEPERVGVDGLLGVDMLEDRSVVMDFRKRRLEIRRSEPSYSLLRRPREVSVQADARFGRLAVVNARVAGVRALAFIDSGGGSSIGNMALARAINARRRGSDPAQKIRLVGSAGAETLGEFRVVKSMELGELRITQLPVVMADLHIFDFWEINDRPAILLGVDVLKMFARVELDFGGGKVRFRLGHGAPAPTYLA